MLAITFLLFIVEQLLSCAYGCIYPTGFGSNPGEIDPSTLNLPDDGIFASFLDFAIPATIEYETPIQFHIVQLNIAVFFNTGAAFDDKSLDHFARVVESEDRRRCQDSNHFDLYRRLTLAYSYYFSFSLFLPEIESDLRDLCENSFNMSVDICDDSNFDCSDISTPWGLSMVLTEEMYQFSLYDGWNRDGSLSREYNKIRYQDFRDEKDRYIPANSPWKLTQKQKWQPLLESDDKGFLFHQEHVTPHIGFTGKSILLGDAEICSREAPDPKYKYDDEIEITLDRMANLTERQKVEIELFDGKFTSLLPFLVQFYVRRNISLDSFEFTVIDTIVASMLYETTMVVWKEKVNHDAVRPPSIIHRELDGEYITTYAGTTFEGETFGTQTFLANDWEPYIRTMPHAEYPSGSSCVCEAFAITMQDYLGSDYVTDFIDGPIVYNANASSSSIEPLSTPSEDVSYFYYTWSEMAQRCGKSRLDGGLHFEASVPAGKELCGDIGSIIVNRFNDIVNGVVPDYVVDINDHEIRNRNC